MPRVRTRLRKIPSRSSRSRPASLMSASEPTDSASRAIAMASKLYRLRATGRDPPGRSPLSLRAEHLELGRPDVQVLRAPRGAVADRPRIGVLLARVVGRAGALVREDPQADVRG